MDGLPEYHPRPKTFRESSRPIIVTGNLESLQIVSGFNSGKVRQQPSLAISPRTVIISFIPIQRSAEV
jgi:hypothetical protein